MFRPSLKSFFGVPPEATARVPLWSNLSRFSLGVPASRRKSTPGGFTESEGVRPGFLIRVLVLVASQDVAASRGVTPKHLLRNQRAHSQGASGEEHVGVVRADRESKKASCLHCADLSELPHKLRGGVFRAEDPAGPLPKDIP